MRNIDIEKIIIKILEPLNNRYFLYFVVVPISLYIWWKVLT